MDEDDVVNFLLESTELLSSLDFSTLGEFFTKKKCSQCKSTSEVYKTSCCNTFLCKGCTTKHLKQEGWFSSKTFFVCPSCAKKTVLS